MNNEEMTPELAIAKAVAKMKDEPATDAQKNTMTKLREAGMWLREHRGELIQRAREHMGKVDGNPS